MYEKLHCRVFVSLLNFCRFKFRGIELSSNLNKITIIYSRSVICKFINSDFENLS